MSELRTKAEEYIGRRLDIDGNNDAYDAGYLDGFKAGHHTLEERLRVAIEFIRAIDKTALAEGWTHIHFKAEDLLLKLKVKQ